MGMFDTIRVKAPVPAGFPFAADAEFQTKGLGRLQEEYEVRADGRLVKVRAATLDDAADYDSLPCDPVPVDFTGELTLTGDGRAGDGRDWRRHRCRLRFAGGVLESIADAAGAPYGPG